MTGMALPAVVTLPWQRGPRDIFQPPLELPGRGGALSPGRMHVVSPLWMLFSADTEIKDLDTVAAWNLVRLDQGPGVIFSVVRNGLFRPAALLERMGANHFRHMDPTNVSRENQPLMDFLAVDYLVAEWVPVWSMDPAPLKPEYIRFQYFKAGAYAGPQPPQDRGNYLLDPGGQWRISLELEPGDNLSWTARPGAALPEITIGSVGSEPVRVMGLAPGLRDGSAIVSLLPVGAGGTYEVNISAGGDAPGPVTMGNPGIVNPARAYQLMTDGHFRLYRNRRHLPLFGIYTEVRVVPEDRILEALFDPAVFKPDQRLLATPDQVDPAIEGDRPRLRRSDDVTVAKYENDINLKTAVAGYLRAGYPRCRHHFHHRFRVGSTRKIQYQRRTQEAPAQEFSENRAQEPAPPIHPGQLLRN
jgi:hypothetical protein